MIPITHGAVALVNDFLLWLLRLISAHANKIVEVIHPEPPKFPACWA